MHSAARQLGDRMTRIRFKTLSSFFIVANQSENRSPNSKEHLLLLDEQHCRFECFRLTDCWGFLTQKELVGLVLSCGSMFTVRTLIRPSLFLLFFLLLT